MCSTCSRSRDGQPCIYDEPNNVSHDDSDIDPEDDSASASPYASDGANGPCRHVFTPMSPQQQYVPSSPDSDGILSISSGAPPSTPPCSLPVLRAFDERQMSYLLVIPLRQSLARLLTLPSSRELAFSNALRLGLCFTSLKERFIRSGDMSGRVVHPWFVWYMTVMGVHLHQEWRHQWRDLEIQGTITQKLLAMVLKMQETQPPFIVFQVYSLMATACTYTHTVVPGQRYLERCQEMIEKHGFRLVDPTWIDASLRGSPSTVDRPSEYTEEKHELVSVLLNIMYLQCINCLLYDECHGWFTDLEAQLPEFEVCRCAITFFGTRRSSIIPQRAYPEVFELSSTVLRVRTVLLVRDVFLHVDLAKKEGP